jgi:hypothetical protein
LVAEAASPAHTPTAFRPPVATKEPTHVTMDLIVSKIATSQVFGCLSFSVKVA